MGRFVKKLLFPRGLLSWEQFNKLTMSCHILYTINICCFSPDRFVCKLEMYSINADDLLLTLYSENCPLKQCVLLTTSVHNPCPHSVHFLCTLYAKSCMHLLLSTIPKSHFSCPGCHPGLHPEVCVQIPNSLSQASDKQPSHDSLQL